MTQFAFGPKQLVTPKEAGKLLGLSERWVYARISEGLLPIIKLRGATRIALADLERLVEKYRR